MIRSVVKGVGGYLPTKILTNAELAQKIETREVNVSLSIVVPFRNEEKSLPQFLESIRIQNYHKQMGRLTVVFYL